MLWFAAALVGAYGLLVAGMYVGQRSLMYHPSGLTPPPALSGLAEMETVSVPATDGFSLYGWWAPPRDAGGPTILYFHGNAGSLADRAERARFYLDQGWGVLMTTYRYNAGLGGAPSEAALVADGRAASRWLEEEKGVPPARTLLYGESLGSGVASALAAEGRGAAIVIDGGFDSMAAVAQRAYPFVPAYWLVKDRWDNAARLAQAPGVAKLIAHGGDDRLVAPRHARALAAAAAAPVRLEILERGGHTDLYEHGLADLMGSFVSEVFESGAD